MAFLPFILRRARRHWHLLLTLIIGVVLATALLASGPLLVDAIVEMGLYLTLQSSSVAEGNLLLAASVPAGHLGLPAIDDEVQAALRARLGDHLDLVVRSAETPWVFPWVGGSPARDQRVKLRFYEGIENRVEYVAGEWPVEPGDDPTSIRAVISDGMARALALRVGDQLPLSLGQDDAAPDAWVEVAAVVRPRNPRDPYWFGESGPLTMQSSEQWPGQYNAIVPLDVLNSTASSLFPEDRLDLAWHVLLRHDSFTADDIGPFQAQLTTLAADLDSMDPHVAMVTEVPDILSRFQIQLESIRVPMYILIAEVMLLILYYVTMVAALLMRQVEWEFAILRSRGASAGQIATIQAVEALIILAIAFMCGPWLGMVLVRGLSWVGPLADVGQADWALNLGPSAWVAAGVGTLACLAGLLIPLGPALRRTIVTHERLAARSPGAPWWQRLYLDVFVLLAGLILLWRLHLYGEMAAAAPGGARLDWLLLLSPVAVLVGSAAVLLRVFPLLLRALAGLVARGPQLPGPLALWQVSRNPTHVTRLVLLLTLAIALAILSTGLSTTLDQSESDRAHYLAGNDMRLIAQQAVPLVDLQSARGVDHLSGAWRGQGMVDLASTDVSTDTGYPRFEVLAIEPDSFGDVASFRKDFAEQDMGHLLDQLAVPQGQHPSLLSLPGQPARFGLWLWGRPEDKAELDSYLRWVDGEGDAERVGVVAKLQTAQGELFTVALHRQESSGQAALQTDRLEVRMTVGGREMDLRFQVKPDNKGWHYLDGTLPALPPDGYPLSLHSLWFENQATRLGEPIAKHVSVVVDDLTVVDAVTLESHVVVDFEDLTRILFLNVMDGSSIWHGLFTSPTQAASRSGESAQGVYMTFMRPTQSYALRLRQIWTAVPLPALASPAFAEATRLEVGDVVRAWIGGPDQAGDQPGAGIDEMDFRIVGTVRYFPTMYEQLDAGYLITSRDLLLAVLNDTSQDATNPNEVLIETDGSASIDSLSPMVPTLYRSWEAESVRQALKANPLALGLRSVTFFGAALTTVLSLVGFATHFYLTVRQREILHGVMRAMGMSARQLYGSIVLEQSVLIMAGLLLGTGLGLLLNQITLPRLPVSLADQPPVPPFVPRADWLAIGSLYLFLVVAFLVILGVVTALLWRARIHHILRIGQE